MAIELITGLPGNAKTLYALRTVIDRAAAENRQVFYAGVKQLIEDDARLKGVVFTRCEPDKWMDCPSGSIILIDEAQKTFRNRSLGAIPPAHVTELEEHRHRGIDFVMLTQHPSLIDPAVRKLTQTHRHMVRIWGMEASTVHRWDGGVRDNCDKPVGRKDSEKVKWGFDKSLYGVYHSADQHTMKRQIPMRVKLLLLVPVLLVAAGWFVYHKLGPKEKGPTAAGATLAHQQAVSSGPMVSSVVRPAENVPMAVSDPLADARVYVAMRTPRIAGLPETAPRYDELTKPVRVPVPAMCVQIGSVRDRGGVRCKCYSQQGTPMDVEYNMCVDVARNGVFRDFDPDPAADRLDSEKRVASAELLSDRDAPPSGSPVLAFTHTPDVSRLSGAPSRQ